MTDLSTQPLCRGDRALGTACGKCQRCLSTQPALEPDYRGVCYKQGKPTVADYNEAITDLLAAKNQLKSGCLMGCMICGDGGHAAQDGCHHDPLLLARQWTAATSVYRCFHCGFIATTGEEAREHFGRDEFEVASCTRPASDREARLEAALRKYGRHDVLCAIVGGYGYCTCGFDAALSEKDVTP